MEELHYGDIVMTRSGDRGRIIALTKHWAIVEHLDGGEMAWIREGLRCIQKSPPQAIVKVEGNEQRTTIDDGQQVAGKARVSGVEVRFFYRPIQKES